MFTLKSTRLKAELQRRISEFSNKRIAVKLTVPPELSFWYIQEFGSAQFNPNSPNPTGYSITPKTATTLSWPNASGGRTFAKSVWHPGVRSTGMVRMTLPEIETLMQEQIGQAIIAGYQYFAAKAALLSVAQKAKELIVESVAQQLPGFRPDGKLQGQTAAQVFESTMEIVESE